MLTATRGDLRFDVHQWGPEDGEPVLLLHGFPQHGGSWAPVAERLAADGFRCIAPDQRGYSPGARPSRRRDYRVNEIVADAVAVVDQLVGSGARVHVVGHDWGAAIAWALAATRGDRVATLTAVSVPPPAAFLRSLVTTRQFFASWYMGFFQLPWLPERILGDERRFAAVMRLTGQHAAAAARDARVMLGSGSLTGALNWYRAMIPPPSVDGVAIAAPTRFVWSDHDAALTRQCTLRAAESVTGPYEYVELPGVSHWIPDEAPAQLAGIVAEHVRAHSTRH